MHYVDKKEDCLLHKLYISIYVYTDITYILYMPLFKLVRKDS